MRDLPAAMQGGDRTTTRARRPRARPTCSVSRTPSRYEAAVDPLPRATMQARPDWSEACGSRVSARRSGCTSPAIRSAEYERELQPIMQRAHRRYRRRAARWAAGEWRTLAGTPGRSVTVGGLVLEVRNALGGRTSFILRRSQRPPRSHDVRGRRPAVPHAGRADAILVVEGSLRWDDFIRRPGGSLGEADHGLLDQLREQHARRLVLRWPRRRGTAPAGSQSSRRSQAALRRAAAAAPARCGMRYVACTDAKARRARRTGRATESIRPVARALMDRLGAAGGSRRGCGWSCAARGRLMHVGLRAATSGCRASHRQRSLDGR